MPQPIAEGDMAPDFSLSRDGGGEISLSGFRGGVAVVYFYPKDDTSGCTTEALAFTSLKPQFEAAGVTVIGISPDSVARHERFKAKHGLDLALAADPDHEVAEAYGVWKEKSMYGRKFMGIERSTFLIGRDGRVARSWLKVRVAGHADDVLAAARALAGSG